MYESRPLNVIWRRGVLDMFLESRFIRAVVLAGLERPVRWVAVEDQAALPSLDDVLVCSFADPGDYLRRLRLDGRHNIGVFHFGDEAGTDDTAFYADADYVFRHYHFPARLEAPAGRCREVIWVPNGWATGVGPAPEGQALPYEARQHSVFFAGFAGGPERVLAEREAMLEGLRARQIPATVILSGGFAQGLGPASYAAYMADTRHALVPAGNSPETIRLYDALELGAVPIIVDRPWLTALDGLGAIGRPPIPTMASWDDLPTTLARVDALVAEGLCESLAAWWSVMKAHVAKSCATAIERSFAVSS